MAGELEIGYIRGRTVHGRFMESLLRFVQDDAIKAMAGDPEFRNLHRGILGTAGPFHEENRNNLVRKFMPAKADWLLQIDTDMVFDYLDIYALYDAAIESGAKILSALCFTRIPQDGHDKPVLVPAQFDFVDGVLNPRMEMRPGVYEIDAAGGACMLVHKSVFLEMEKHYQGDSWKWYGRDLVMTPTGPERMGEDITFCIRAKKHGFKVYGCGHVVFNHMKEREEDLETFCREHGITPQIEGAEVEQCAMPDFDASAAADRQQQFEDLVRNPNAGRIPKP